MIEQSTYSREKIQDEFTGMLKSDGTPASRAQIHMARKKRDGICRTCSEPVAVRVLANGTIRKKIHCEKHSRIAADREREGRRKLRRLKGKRK